MTPTWYNWVPNLTLDKKRLLLLHRFLSFCYATASRLLQPALCVHDTGVGFLEIKVSRRSGIALLSNGKRKNLNFDSL